MENLATQIWLGIGAAFVSFVVGLFKKEIATMWKAWKVYKSRPFDSDRDPDTPDRCEVLGGNAQGGTEWKEVEIVKYKMSRNADLRGVYINHLLDSGKKAAEKIPLVTWGDLRKRAIPK